MSKSLSKFFLILAFESRDLQIYPYKLPYLSKRRRTVFLFLALFSITELLKKSNIVFLLQKLIQKKEPQPHSRNSALKCQVYLLHKYLTFNHTKHILH